MTGAKNDLSYRDHSDSFCQMISHLSMLVCLDIVDNVVIFYLYLVTFLLSLSDVFFFLLCYQLW